MDERKAVMFVIIAACLWGIMGFFTRGLRDAGASSMQTTFIRCFVTFLSMTVILLIMDRGLFRIDFRDIWMFIGTGLFSVVLSNVIFIYAQQYATLSVATLLVYTAPCFVVLLSAILFKDRLTKKKIAAVICTFIGCVFATGSLTSGQGLDVFLLIGLLSGFGYGLYTIFSKYALKKYKFSTILFYTFMIASLCLLPFSDVAGISAICSGTNIFLAIGLGVVCTVLPYGLYTLGLKTLDASRASIYSFLEPLVATLLGIAMGDILGWDNVIGMIVIIVSILLLNNESNSSEDNA